MKLEILHVPDCPNVAVLEQRIRQVTASQPEQHEIIRRVIADPGRAATARMTGSPTLLVDGCDPFATPGQVPSLSCRLYPSDTGRLDGAPSVGALRAALRLVPDGTAAFGSDTASSCCNPPAAESPATVLRSWRAAAQPADPTEKAVHRSGAKPETL